MSRIRDEVVLHKSIVVACPVEHAFRVFTARMNDWWPFEGHSIFDGDATIVWDPEVGGRVYERTPDGEEGLWGTIVAWEPPRSFAMSWHPGRGKETVQDLSVTFTEAPNGTRVDLVHSGWDRAEDAADRLASYGAGWDKVLDVFADAAASR